MTNWRTSRLFCIAMIVVLTLLLCCACAYAAESNSAEAPEGYAPKNTYINTVSAMPRGDDALPRVLLIEDVNPWDSVANQTVLGKITQYDKVTTKEFLSVDLSKYGVVVFANDQPFSTYENYAEFKEYLETFASIGGVIVFGACDAGWSNGELIEALPGDVTKKTHYVYRNHVANSNHAIVSGMLTDNAALTDSMLYHNYCSHVSFDESSLPAGSTVILRENDTNRPTLVEYPLGKGRVIASGLTWEHNYAYANGSPYGMYAKQAMEDMFRYAIRVSSIDVNELHLLEQWQLKVDNHTIIVAKALSDLKQLDAIPGALVTVDGKTYTADENGMVEVQTYGTYEVKVTVPGYYPNSLTYELAANSSRIIYMEKDPGGSLPYVTGVSMTDPMTYGVDVRNQALHFASGSPLKTHVMLSGDWNGHGAGVFRIFQGSNVLEPDAYIDIAPFGMFAPGQVFKPNKQVKLQMIAADGARSAVVPLNIYIREVKVVSGSGAAGLKEGSGELAWMADQNVASKSDEFSLMFNKGFTLKTDLVPIEISKSNNEDGTYTWRLTVGFVKGEGKYNIANMEKEELKDFKYQNAWTDLVEEIDKLKDAKNFKSYFKTLKDKYGSKWKTTKIKASFDVESNVVGYAEWSFDQAGKQIGAAGSLAADASGKAVVGKTFITPVGIPVYIEGSFGASIGANMGIGLEKQNNEMKVVPTYNGIELTLPEFSIGGGVGVRGVATAGVEGKGGINMELFKFPGSKGDFKLDGSIKVKVVFVVDWSWKFGGLTVPMWNTTQKNLNAQMRAALGEPTITLTSRDYLAGASRWNDQGLSAVVKGDNTSLTQLQRGVMPDALPKLYQVGDDLVLLYLEDNAARQTGNHTRLVYSMYNNGRWTAPVAVWESDSADFFFDGVVVGDELHVVWQKSASAVSETDPMELLDEVAENSEICYAVWSSDRAAFGAQQYLTKNSTLDMMPCIAAKGEELSVVWVVNDANNMLGTDGNYLIKSVSIRNGRPGKVQTMHKTSEYIVELSAGISDGKLQVLYLALDENDEARLYHVTGHGAKKLAGGVQPVGLMFEEGRFLWQSEGTLYRYTPSSNKVSVLLQNAEKTVASNYQYVNNGKTASVVWHEDMDEGGTVFKASVYESKKWSAPVTLVELPDTNVSFSDVMLSDDGTYIMALNQAEYNSGDIEATALSIVKVKPMANVSLDYASLSAPDWENQKQTLNLLVTNDSAETISAIRAKVYSGQKVLLDKNLSVDLKPGETEVVTSALDLSIIDTVMDARVEISVSNDSDPSDNHQTIVLGHTDAALCVDAYEKNNDIMFVFTVGNSSNTKANAALSIIEDKEDGIVIDVKNIGVIDNSEYVQYLYTLDKDEIDFDDDGLKTYFFKLDLLEADWNEKNNLRTYTVSKTPDDHSHECEVVAFLWSEDYSACDAMVRCTDCEAQMILSCTVTVEEVPATETEGTKFIYTATAEYEDQVFTDTVIVSDMIIPDTGDDSNVLAWLMLMIASAAAMMAILAVRGKRRFN